MLHATAVGRLGAEPELRMTKSGREVTGFRLGINVYAEGEKQVVWLSGSIWGKRGDTFRQFCHKGDQVTVTGPLYQQTYQDRNGQQVTKLAMDVQDFTLPPAPKEPAAPAAATSFSNSDVPF